MTGSAHVASVYSMPLFLSATAANTKIAAFVIVWDNMSCCRHCVVDGRRFLLFDFYRLFFHLLTFFFFGLGRVDMIPVLGLFICPFSVANNSAIYFRMSLGSMQGKPVS